MEMQNSKMVPIPPGFKFRPRDYELVNSYLQKLLNDPSRPTCHIETVDLYEEDTPAPWELFESRGLSIKNDTLYFFTKLKSKSGNDERTSRKTEQGTWLQQATKPVKKTVLKASRTTFSYFLNDKVTNCLDKKGGSTGWIMQQFKLDEEKTWTVCKLHFKENKNKKMVSAEPEQGMLLGTSSSSDQAIHYSTMPIAAADPMNKLPIKSLKRKFTNVNEDHNSSKQQFKSVGELSVYSQNFDYSQPQSSHLCSSSGRVTDPAPAFQNLTKEPCAPTDEQDNNIIWENWKIMAETDNLKFDCSKLLGLGDECEELGMGHVLPVPPLFEYDHLTQLAAGEESTDPLSSQQCSEDQWLPVEDMLLQNEPNMPECGQPQSGEEIPAYSQTYLESLESWLMS